MKRVKLTELRVGDHFYLANDDSKPMWTKGEPYDEYNTIIYKGEFLCGYMKATPKKRIVYIK